MITAPNSPRKNPHRRRSAGGVDVRRFVVGCPLHQRGHDIQGGGGRHPALLPALDCAPRYSAEISQRLSGQPTLVADRLDAWGVVHDLAAIREDDGLAVGASTVVSGNSHGLVVVTVKGDLANLEISLITLKFGRDTIPALAITATAGKLSGGGFGDRYQIVTVHILPVRFAGGKCGADVVGLESVKSIESKFDDLCNWLGSSHNMVCFLWVGLGEERGDELIFGDVARSLVSFGDKGDAVKKSETRCAVAGDSSKCRVTGYSLAVGHDAASGHLLNGHPVFYCLIERVFFEFRDQVLDCGIHFRFGLVRGLIASTPARYAVLRNESTSFYAKMRIYFHAPKNGILPHND